MTCWHQYLRWQRLVLLHWQRGYHKANAYLYWQQGQDQLASDAECRAYEIERLIDKEQLL